MIRLDHVSVDYPLIQFNAHSLRAQLAFRLQRLIRRGEVAAPVRHVRGIDDVTLEIRDGDRLGVIGHNGAGKTTLLRVLAGVYPPTSGEVHIEGTISSLTDFTLGMDQNVDGVKNIIFRLVFMGKTFEQAREALPEIVEFSGLGEDIHRPLYTYSTGMFLRLAFSISTHFPPDILILDEIIGAGDEAFREKAAERIRSMLASSRIVVLSSHDVSAIRQYCDRVAMMEGGRLVEIGEPDAVIETYQKRVA